LLLKYLPSGTALPGDTPTSETTFPVAHLDAVKEIVGEIASANPDIEFSLLDAFEVWRRWQGSFSRSDNPTIENQLGSFLFTPNSLDPELQIRCVEYILSVKPNARLEEWLLERKRKWGSVAA
jgi:hypothetical protein